MSAVTAVDVVLDRSSPIPLYFQVARQIESAIERGELLPGQRLDNEIDLADRFGLSRPTLRKAIEELVAKGLLVRKRGVGTQVVQGQLNRPVELSSLHDDLTKTLQRPSTRVISCGMVPADAEVSLALGVPAGETVLAIERVRLARDEPLALMRNWLPAPPGRTFCSKWRSRGSSGAGSSRSGSPPMPSASTGCRWSRLARPCASS